MKCPLLRYFIYPNNNEDVNTYIFCGKTKECVVLFSMKNSVW